MAVNKNFVVKNGLEVSDSLIFADALEGRVGVGTTAPKEHLLHVFGGIGVTDAYVTGITTIAENLQVGPGGTVLNVLAAPGIGNSVGIGNSTPEYLLDVRAPVSTGQTALYVRGDARITGDLYVRDDLTIDELSARNIDVSSQTSVNFLNVIGVSTFASNIDANHDLNVIGISTFESNVDINADLDVDGRTELDTTNISETLNVVGISTFASNVDINAELDVEDDASFGGDIRIKDESTTNILLMNDGAATFAGIGSFGSDLYVDGNLNVVGDVVYDEVNGRNLNISGISTTQNLEVSNHTSLNTLNVSGISTLTNQLEIRSDDLAPGRIDFYCEVNNIHRVRLKSPPHSEYSGNPDVVLPSISGDLLVGDTASPISQDLNTTGIITASYFYGDGTFLDNVIRGVGIQTGGGPVSHGATILNFAGPGVSTAYYDSNVGVGTIFFEGGGANVEVSNSAPLNASLGDLWFHSELGRTFVYYDENRLGVGTDSFWVDAAPVNTAAFPSTVRIGTGITFYGSSGDAWFEGIATATEFDALSDINFKENIQTVDNALDKIMSLRGVSFDWKKSKEPSFGVIAQELEQVFPDLVHGESPKAVNYNGLVGILIESIKDMKQEIVSLNEEIQSLKQSINN